MADETIAPSGPRQSWDRRKDESKRAWTAFCLFRDSTTRRLADVAAGLTPRCSVPNVARWSARHQWQARAADYDCYVDEQDRAEIARGRSAARKRRLAIAQALEGLSAHAIREWQTRLAAGLPLNMSMETAALLARTAAQLEDAALGPEKHNTFAKIIVNLTDAEPLPDPPAEARPALCDDTTGETVESGTKRLN